MEQNPCLNSQQPFTGFCYEAS